MGVRQRPGGFAGMLWHRVLRWVNLSGAGARVGDEAVARIDVGRGGQPRLSLHVRGRYGEVRLREQVWDLGPPLITRRPWLGTLRVTWTPRALGPAARAPRAMTWRGRRAVWHLGGLRLRVLGMAWIEPWVGLSVRQPMARPDDGYAAPPHYDLRLAWRDPTLGIVSWLRVDLSALDGAPSDA